MGSTDKNKDLEPTSEPKGDSLTPGEIDEPKAAAGNAFDQIATINSMLQLFLQVGNLAIPLFSGLLQSLRSKVNADGEIEYTVVLKTGQERLNAAEQDFRGSLDLVNAELAKLGKEPLVVPPVRG